MNLVLGLGSTGISLARYLRKNKQPFLIMDSRKEPPGLQEVIKESLDNRLASALSHHNSIRKGLNRPIFEKNH